MLFYIITNKIQDVNIVIDIILSYVIKNNLLRILGATKPEM